VPPSVRLDATVAEGSARPPQSLLWADPLTANARGSTLVVP
jgi:hypothetical protein